MNMSGSSLAKRRASSVSTTELARQRDLDKYYQPWLDSKKLRAVPANTGPNLSQPALASHDTTLTALAQLAALRLNVKRGMVSLIDRDTQIILAEATQTLSLVDESRHAPGDHIWLGNVSLPRRDCMDEHTFGSIMTWQDSEGRDVNIPAFVVNETLEDDRFKSRPYVTAGASVRFYAGVPIVTKQGYAIGVYAVSDIRPRPKGLTLDEARFMEDVARIVADHLERVMDTVGRVSERDFMRGISYFLEDLSEFKHQISSNDRSLQTSTTRPRPDTRATGPQLEPVRGRSNQSQSTDMRTSTSLSPSTRKATHGQVDARQVPRFSSGSKSRGKEDTDSSMDNIRRIFSQASQLLCQQSKAAGCVFTDAASGLFSGEEGTSPRSTDPAPTADVNFESTEDEEEDVSNARREADTSAGSESNLPQVVFGNRPDEMADILSVAMAKGDSNQGSHDVVKRKNLKKLILRYPFGKCFYLNRGRAVSNKNLILDEFVIGGGGTRHSVSGPSIDDTDNQHHLLPRELLSYLPDAKWLIFLPLFSHSQGQWFAAGFIWGDDFKVGDPDDALPYFKTFGSCMVSEVASMEVLNTNIAKSTFIASISHDLRSPLHGMLGSLEFLEETMTSAYQTTLIGAIETCGKTLLDTIDHLLDYAKINNLNRTSSHLSPPKGQKTWKGPRELEESMSTTFNFAVLLEEVVEAVFAGQTFRKVDLRHHGVVDESTAGKVMNVDDSLTTEEQIHAGSIKFSGKVFLTLHIQKAESWCLRGQTGGLRRVIMNVVGNAIKYCSTGYIDVSLKSKQITSSDVEVELSVHDTGVGMSQTFLTNQLFKAFSQEDPFTPGAGLGLSIASQIVNNMSGKIKVDSEKGVGTHVKITIPMKSVAAAPGSFGGINDDVLRDAISATTGKKACILDPELDDHGGGDKELSRLESSVSALCQDWFEMAVTQSRNVEADPDTAIFIYAEPPPIEHLVQQHLERKRMGNTGKEAALLIICTNAFEAAALRAAGIKDLVSLGRIIEVISQPVGVRKLGKVLTQCLQRVEASGNMSPRENSPSRPVNNVAWNSTPVVYDQLERQYRPSVTALKWKSEQPQIGISAEENEQMRSASTSGLRSPVPPESAQSTRPRSGDDSHQPRVLLVDDNAINLKLLVTFMNKIKLPYSEAVNGLEAINKYKEAKEPFDFVLMDLQMPVMDGLEATRRIREFEQERSGAGEDAAQSTIIAITGVGNEATRTEAMEAGMSQFLTKPVKFKTLQKLLLEDKEPPHE
ncbi:hypothetical protein GGR52DRAFT_94365 [Hypoxylon sp. FL1284]|nr:hypothetical protein GGR52DRAFT_94365 [Hypoxylon sp. FL1284]